MSTGKLPPLPKEFCTVPYNSSTGVSVYTSDQMQDYGQASRKAALEEVEKLLWLHHTTYAQSLAIKEL